MRGVRWNPHYAVQLAARRGLISRMPPEERDGRNESKWACGAPEKPRGRSRYHSVTLEECTAVESLDCHSFSGFTGGTGEFFTIKMATACLGTRQDYRYTSPLLLDARCHCHLGDSFLFIRLFKDRGQAPLRRSLVSLERNLEQPATLE